MNESGRSCSRQSVARAKGFWKDNETFVIDYYDEIANINHYQLELKLSEKEVFIKLSEKTGTAQLNFSGKLKS